MSDSPHYATTATLSLTQAIDAALARVPGTAYKAKLKEKKGTLVYKIAILGAAGPAEVKVDPASGEILKVKEKHSGRDA